MTERIQFDGLQIAESLSGRVESQIVTDIGIEGFQYQTLFKYSDTDQRVVIGITANSTKATGSTRARRLFCRKTIIRNMLMRDNLMGVQRQWLFDDKGSNGPALDGQFDIVESRFRFWCLVWVLSAKPKVVITCDLTCSLGGKSHERTC